MTHDTRPRAPCAHETCNVLSMVRVQTPTGWANLCLSHYASQNDEEARRYCRDHGLDTTEKKIAHCRSLWKKPRDPRAWMKNPKSDIARQWRDEILARENSRTRTPGEDDELEAAA